MRFTRQLFKRTAFLMALSIILLSPETAFSQPEITVEPGENTLLIAIRENPGSTLILKRGEEYVIDTTILITTPTIIRGEGYSLDDANPPALIRMFAGPGEAGSKIMFAAAADLTLMNLGFIGFTSDNQQIYGVLEIMEEFLNIEVEGCIVQSFNTFILTNNVPGTQFVLHNNIHFNMGKQGWSSWGGFGGPAYKGDSIINESYNNTYFVGGRYMASAGTGPNGSQFINHNTYVNTNGMTFHRCKDKGFSLTNCILFNTFLLGYVGVRTSADGQDTIWEGDHMSWKMDSLNGDFAIHPHLFDSVGGPREVIVTNNLKYNEQRVLDWNVANNVATQPFFNVHGWLFAERYNWDISKEANFLDEEGTSFNPEFEMGEIPIGALEKSWEERLNRMVAGSTPIEVAWRPGGEEQKEFIWPLPFNFKPTNDAALTAGSDGYPLGDLNWFGKDMVEAWENGWPLPVESVKMKLLDLSLMNYPNPFSFTTRIRYDLPVSSHVSMKIYDLTGSIVVILVNEHQMAGMHEIMFDGATLSAGLYFCKIQAGSLSQNQKMTLIK